MIAGNFIGTDATGTVALPNGGNGVTIAAGTSKTTIGAETSGNSNLNIISGNKGDGISITSSSGNNVSFNYIGVNLNNQGALPNGGNGVSIHAASGNRVNLDVIRNNGGYGILTDTGATDNAWYYDSIYANGLGSIAQPSNPVAPGGAAHHRVHCRSQRYSDDHRDDHGIARPEFLAGRPVVRQSAGELPERLPGPDVPPAVHRDDQWQRQRQLHRDTA